jgi:hypothetical protein
MNVPANLTEAPTEEKENLQGFLVATESAAARMIMM